VAVATDWSRLVGYADRLSARPGEGLRVMASAEAEVEARVVSLPDGAPVGDAKVRSLGGARVQPAVTGSHVVVDRDAPGEELSVSTWVWLAPGARATDRAELIASRDASGEGFALTLEGLRPRFEVGDSVVESGREIERGVWSRLEAVLDPDAGTAGLTVDGETRVVPATATSLGGCAQAVIGVGLDGKLDTPRVGTSTWGLREGTRVNGPLRAVTGHNWTGDLHDWRAAPDQYRAMHFHTDAVDDLGWEASFEVTLGESLASGVYALELSADGVVDLVAFAVRGAADAEPAANVLVLPTFTYLAYSCERAATADSDQPEDRWVDAHGLRSLYDRYEDGTGVYEASLLRPLTQMRPGYRCPQHGGPPGLAQDLILLAWLRRRGITCDVVTDHDLHADGATALAGHRTVITGAHPEYASAALLDAYEEHLRGGGNLAYLGGNGMNGSVSVDAERPHVLEVRRTETQGLVWQAEPGEHHHASGEYGGDWRRRGRPEHRTLGVGLRAFGDGPAAAYVRPTKEDPAAAIVFAGLDPDAPIDARGVVQGGPAGYEVDGFDPRAGSPPDTIILASAPMGDGYERWPDDVIDEPGSGPPLQADMTLLRRPGGGAVFSVGSIAWTGCLTTDDNPISRITENVLVELARPQPFAFRQAGRTESENR
jgi:N,N-dimethylformamidase